MTQSDGIMVTAVDSAAAFAYLKESMETSPMARAVGIERLQGANSLLRLVTFGSPPAGSCLSSEWGGRSGPCEEWLVDEATGYTEASMDAIVLFEDMTSSPSDPYLVERKHPDFWIYGGKLFWPASARFGGGEHIEAALSWSASRRITAWFTTVLAELLPPHGFPRLSEESFSFLASHVSRLVTTVFDGEGFIVWERGADKRDGEAKRDRSN